MPGVISNNKDNQHGKQAAVGVSKAADDVDAGTAGAWKFGDYEQIHTGNLYPGDVSRQRDHASGNSRERDPSRRVHERDDAWANNTLFG